MLQLWTVSLTGTPRFFISFTDFKKTFDSLYRDPAERVQCTVIVDRNLSEWLVTARGSYVSFLQSPFWLPLTGSFVRQHMKNPEAFSKLAFLFLMTWTLPATSPFSFQKHNKLQEKTDRLNTFNMHTCLSISTRKTQCDVHKCQSKCTHHSDPFWPCQWL